MKKAPLSLSVAACRMREVFLPTFHPGQVAAYMLPGRFKAIRCGRRWGKTDYGKTVACDGAIKRQNHGWFTPDYKIQSEAYAEIAEILEPVKKSASEMKGVIRTTTRGRIDFWTLNNRRAGRSRKYHHVIIDEGAFTDEHMMEIWDKSIMPTLLDYEGKATVLSNTNGTDPANFFWRICNEPEHGFVEYHAPTSQNPYMPPRELERLKQTTHPLVFKQEYEAEFIDWSGVQFFDLQSLLVNGIPVEEFSKCDAVFATIDSATKTGSQHDGTGVIYWALNKNYGTPLVILDYAITQIEGALLETWLPTVYQNLEMYAAMYGARVGSVGAWIEDKASGTILLQQAHRREWPAIAIDSLLTAMGKDERAISVSGYVYQGLVKLSQRAYDKIVQYKGHSRNHLLSQVLGFRIGDKDRMREDDLVDCFTYGVAMALGNAGGF